MVDFNKIDEYLIKIKTLNDINLDEIKSYLLNLNLTNEEKEQLLTKLFTYDIEKFNSILFTEIINKYGLNKFISTTLEYRIYEKLIHIYLYYKILSRDEVKSFLNKVQDIINNPIENLEDNLINKLTIEEQNNLNDNLKKELIHINNFINENKILNKDYLIHNDFIRKIVEECKINYNIDENNNILPYNKLIINKLKKHNYKVSLKKYYHKGFLQSYQCYFKAAINFFLNNSEFNRQIIEVPNNELSDLSDTIDSLKMGDGNYTEFYDLIKNMYEDDINNKNIDF